MAPRWLRYLARECVDFPVTMFLCAVYLGLFVLMAFAQSGFSLKPHHGLLGWLSIDPKTLVDFGAIEVDSILAHSEYWRLVTATLLHGSVPHVALNLLALYQLGRIIEDWYGGATLLFLHLVLGLAGSIVSLWMHRLLPHLVQIGGSGAIFGFCGFLTVAVYFDDEEHDPALFRALLVSLFIGFGLGHLLNADNSAHAGGAIAGAALGCFDYLFRREFLNRRIAVALGLSSLGVFILAFAADAKNYGQRVDQRRQVEQAERRAKERALQAIAQERLKASATQLLFPIFEHATRVLGGLDTAPLSRRDERAEVLDHLAQQIHDHDFALRLRNVAVSLRVPDDEYMRPDHLKQVIEQIKNRNVNSDAQTDGDHAPHPPPTD